MKLARLDAHRRRSRRIVPGVLSGARRRDTREHRGAAHINNANHPFDLLARYPTGPEDRRPIPAQVEHRRLDADRARPAIENQIDGVTQFIMDMPSRRRTDMIGFIGARPRDLLSKRPQ